MWTLIVAIVSAGAAVAAAALIYWTHLNSEMRERAVQIRGVFDAKSLGERTEGATARLLAKGWEPVWHDVRQRDAMLLLLAELNRLALVEPRVAVWELAVNNVELHRLFEMFEKAWPIVVLVRHTKLAVTPCWNGDRSKAFAALEALVKQIGEADSLSAD
ncbi:MAG TPA: hypothetical protein VNU97_04755 [Rhizomicrobium sp.]|jgi:hypothetical protein|nr:hypothetical protein [Rhizomicrobium sp.]